MPEHMGMDVRSMTCLSKRVDDPPGLPSRQRLIPCDRAR